MQNPDLRSRSLKVEAGTRVASLEMLARLRVSQDPGHVITLHQSEVSHKHFSVVQRIAEPRLTRRMSEAILL